MDTFKVRTNDSQMSKKKIDGDSSLIYFNSWLESKRSEHNFDHAFGVTAYDIVNLEQNYDYNGLAYIYGICRKS